MKKKILLTTAILLGTMNFASAADSFSDVPRGHWAYDAVEQLAEKGIISGYGDSTFRGNNTVTRYEMAQMIAQALKNVEAMESGNVQVVRPQPTQSTQPTTQLPANRSSNNQDLQAQINDLQQQILQLQEAQKKPQVATLSRADRAMLDRLASEFAEELQSMNVRVSALEKKAGSISWTGEVRYTYTHNKIVNAKTNTNQLQLRLFPTAVLNKNWTMKARLTATTNTRTDNSGDVNGTYYYLNGDYGKFNIAAGKMPFYTADNEGLIADDFFSGVQLSYNVDDKIKAILEAGEWDGLMANGANYIGAQVLYDSGDKLNAGLAYRMFDADNLGAALVGYDDATDDKANVISAGVRYNLSDDISLFGAYAMNTKADDYDNAYNIEVNYRGVDKNVVGSWGAYAAYRRLTPAVTFAPTYNTATSINRKGFELGAAYSPFRNTTLEAAYFFGDRVTDGEDSNTFYTRMRFFF